MKSYYKKNGRSLAAFLIVNLLAAASSVLMSFLLGLFADSAIEGDFSRVWKIALVTLCYLVVETGLSFLMDYTRDVFVQRIGRDLRADTVRKIERLSETEKSKTDDGQLLSLMNNDIDTIQQEYLASIGAIYFSDLLLRACGRFGACHSAAYDAHHDPRQHPACCIPEADRKALAVL